MHKFFLLATAIATQTAMAHQGAHHQDENIAFWHWLTEPDHLAFGAIILISLTVMTEKWTKKPMLDTTQHALTRGVVSEQAGAHRVCSPEGE